MPPSHAPRGTPPTRVNTLAATFPFAFAIALVLGATLPAHALTQGTDTTSFNAVGRLGGASGVQIADDWVLTAGHVAQSLQPGRSSFDSMAGHAVVDGVFIYGDAATPNYLFPRNDIALVHLADPIAAHLPVLADAVLKSSPANPVVGPLWAVAPRSSALNQEGGMALVGIEANRPDGLGGRLAVNWLITAGGSTVQGGDSGSALFQGGVSDSGQAVLMGIASAALLTANGVPESAYVQVASYQNWIRDTMAKVDAGHSTPVAPGPGSADATVGSVPEASGWQMLCLGLAGVAWARLRRRPLQG